MRGAWLLLACCAAAALSAADPPGGMLRAADLVGAGWRADDVSLAWRWQAGDATGVDLTIGALKLDGLGTMRDIRLECRSAYIGADRVRCPRSRVNLIGPSGLPLRGELGFDYVPSRNELEIALQRLDVCSGQVRGKVVSGDDAWHAALQVSALDPACVAKLVAPGEAIELTVSAGTLAGDLQFGVRDGIHSLGIDLAFRGLAFGNAAGTLAGEELEGRIAAALRGDGAAWRGDIELRAARGVLFREPVLIDAARAPLTVRGKVQAGADGRIEVTAFELDQGALLELAGTFALHGAPLTPSTADLAFASAALDGFYTAWLQPLLIGTALDELELQGAVRGRLHGTATGWNVEVQLEDVALLDRTGRFAFGGLAGNLAWGDGSTPASHLRWAGGQVLGLAVGASEAGFTLRDGTLRLLAPLRQPLVDGVLAVTALDATGIGSGTARMQLEAELEPVSLEALGYAFGWPLMAGTIGGAVPSLRYADATLAVDGELRVDVFDGTIRIRDPRLERPLGPLTALHADIAVDNLDLELLTRTFTIGRIQGRLGGRVDGLLLHDWRPVRFDAELATPPGDDSRRRISQRAVDSITSIGGLGGALSQSALRFFKEFGYSRLGFRCRLRGAVCELDGVEPASAGYYLVKGGGLPRIDIIGHVRRVDWAELVNRLQRAMAAPAPVVK